MAIPTLNARPKKPKSGKVKDNVYTDSKYGFSINVLDGWKYKTQNAKSGFRLMLIKKTFETPFRYSSAPDYTMNPKITMWVGETNYTPFQFIDSLLSDSYKSDSKKELLKEFEILRDRISEGGNTREKLIAKQKKPIKFGKGIKAVSWTGKLNYRREIANSASSIGGTRVKGSYGGALIAVKKGKMIYMFHMISEIEYFKPNLAATMQVVKSLNWGGSDKEKDKK